MMMFFIFMLMTDDDDAEKKEGLFVFSFFPDVQGQVEVVLPYHPLVSPLILEFFRILCSVVVVNTSCLLLSVVVVIEGRQHFHFGAMLCWCSIVVELFLCW